MSCHVVSCTEAKKCVWKAKECVLGSVECVVEEKILYGCKELYCGKRLCVWMAGDCVFAWQGTVCLDGRGLCVWMAGDCVFGWQGTVCLDARGPCVWIMFWMQRTRPILSKGRRMRLYYVIQCS